MLDIRLLVQLPFPRCKFYLLVSPLARRLAVLEAG